MEHNDHVNLLRKANIKPGGSWADLGAGSGAFTFALRELAGSTTNLYAVDKDRSSINDLERGYIERFGDSHNLHLIVGDFTHTLDLPPLEGVLMANSLHFFRNKGKVLSHIRSLLKPNGVLLVVEYNVDTGNMWVPYPFSFGTFRELALQAGFTEPFLLGTIPSRFLREFYSAMVYKKEI